LDAEEIHDAIAKATGVLPTYTWSLVNGQTVERGSALPQSAPVNWAMQLPDINEPRANTGGGRDFMAAFHRGNRDTAQRSQSGSILQQLNLMNNVFVTSRIRISASPVLRGIAQLQDNAQLVDELWLNFLSREPSPTERNIAIGRLANAKTNAERNRVVEDLAWASFNRTEFLFSY
jgi:hypothetical protein